MVDHTVSSWLANLENWHRKTLGFFVLGILFGGYAGCASCRTLQLVGRIHLGKSESFFLPNLAELLLSIVCLKLLLKLICPSTPRFKEVSPFAETCGSMACFSGESLRSSDAPRPKTCTGECDAWKWGGQSLVYGFGCRISVQLASDDV